MAKLILYFILFSLFRCSGLFVKKNLIDIDRKLSPPPTVQDFKWFNDPQHELAQCAASDTEAIEKVKNIVLKTPTDYLANKKMADCMAVSMSFSQAFYYYDRALALRKVKDKPAGLYNNLGVIFAHKGFYSYAEFYFKKARNLDPKDPVSLFNSSILRMKRGKYLESASLIANRLRYQSDKNYWYKLIGVNYFLQGNMDKDLFKTIEKINDTSSELEFLRMANSYGELLKGKSDPTDLLEQVSAIDLKDSFWRDAKREFLQRIKREFNEKNRGHLSNK
jgi:tetratricopeptide (TPR) repeat protein